MTRYAGSNSTRSSVRANLFKVLPHPGTNAEDRVLADRDSRGCLQLGSMQQGCFQTLLIAGA